LKFNFRKMDIRKTLLEEKVQSKELALSIADYAVKSKKNFYELMQCFVGSEYRLAQRAAWCVSWAARMKPSMILPYIKLLVDQLERKDVHDAVIRNSVRVLEDIEIPEELHGVVMNACFNLIEKASTPVAIKAFSLTTLYKLSKKYPEIRPELKLLIEEKKEHETIAFCARANKILPFL